MTTQVLIIVYFIYLKFCVVNILSVLLPGGTARANARAHMPSDTGLYILTLYLEVYTIYIYKERCPKVSGWGHA